MSAGPVGPAGASRGGLGPQLLYASGAFGFNLLFQTMSLWLVYFYAPPPDSGRSTIVPLATLGALMTVGRVLDAVDDPAIGHWSDSTRSRWGRRLPFVAAGAPIAALVFVAIWNPPAWDLPWIAVYAFVVLQLYSVCSTIVHQPYEAVLAELSRASADRMRVSGLKVLFGVVGAAVGLVGSGAVVGAYGFGGMGVIFALVAGVSILVAALGIRRLPALPAAEARLPLREGLRLTATNRQFLIFTCSEVAFSLALSLLTGLVPYYVTVLLGRTEGDVPLFTGAFFLVVLAALPAVGWLAARRSKAFAYRLAMAVLAMMLPGLAVVDSLPWGDPFVSALAYVALLGAPMSVVFVLPNPMIADIVDQEERRTGLRRAGAYFGVEETIAKAGSALAAALFAFLLGTFGFSGAQSLGLRLVGPVAGVVVFLGLLVFTVGYRVPEANGAGVRG